MAGETRIQVRRDTAAAWSVANPILADGEFGLDRTSRKMKLGDGVTPWNTLGYLDGDGRVYLEQLFVDGAAEGSGIYVQDSEYVPGIPKTGGPSTDWELPGWAYTRVLYGTEAQFPTTVPTGTLVYVSDYPDGARLRYMKPGATSVDESEAILTPYSTVLPNKINQSGATTGQVLKWSGSAWAPAADESGGTLVGPESSFPSASLNKGDIIWITDHPPESAFRVAWDDGTSWDDTVPILTGLSTIPLSSLSQEGATAGQVPTFNGTTVGWATPVDTKGALQVNSYAAGTSGTWSKHPSAKLVRILAIGGGGGGGGGDLYYEGSSVRGGGAGAAGCIVDMCIPADHLGSTEAYSVGSGGSGGAGATSYGTGADGTAGGNTTFGTSFLVASGGEQGYSGGGSGSSKIAGCFITNTLYTPTSGGTGSGGFGTPGAQPPAAVALMPTAGGGGGGINNTSSSLGSGGAGGILSPGFTNYVMPTNPASAGGAINGGDGAHGVSKYGIGWGGGGGGCGSADGTVRGGNGGNGGFPGGGGGGGGGAREIRGGNGGNGGNGMLLIIQT